MSVNVEKVPGALMVDGIKIMKGKCGCTSIAKCCYTWTTVKKKGDNIRVEAKMTTPDTKDLYNWGYTVKKNGTTVTVKVEDARDKEIFSGYIPPSVDSWKSKGWEVVEKSGTREDDDLWRCAMCKWLYNDNKEGTPFEQLPDDWKCPKCGVSKRDFENVS